MRSLRNLFAFNEDDEDNSPNDTRFTEKKEDNSLEIYEKSNTIIKDCIFTLKNLMLIHQYL